MTTMKDVAKYADVSVATVSKYLNGGNILKENEKNIEKAIEELDYRVNVIARGLKINKSMTVGVLIPSLRKLFFTSIISYITDELQENGYSTIVCDYKEDKEVEETKLEFLIDKMVDGIILVPYQIDKQKIKDILNRDISLLLLDRMTSGIDCDTVLTDSLNGSYRAVEKLFERGHKRIGIITGPKDVYTSRERLKGYKRVHEDYNIEIDQDLIKYGDYKVQGGYEKTKDLWKLKSSPTALFATNYEMTVGSLMAINELEIKIPEELSLIGFDDIMQLSKIYAPSLSIVSQPMEKLGRTAAEILLKRLKGKKENYPQIKRLKTDISIKKSVIDI